MKGISSKWGSRREETYNRAVCQTAREIESLRTDLAMSNVFNYDGEQRRKE